jgi:hypothetical protein
VSESGRGVASELFFPLALPTPAKLAIAAVVLDHDAPLKTSCAEPQSVDSAEAPSAVQRSLNFGVDIDARDPATQFTAHGMPPKVAFRVGGKEVPVAATRMRCVAPETVM